MKWVWLVIGVAVLAVGYTVWKKQGGPAVEDASKTQTIAPLGDPAAEGFSPPAMEGAPTSNGPLGESAVPQRRESPSGSFGSRPSPAPDAGGAGQMPPQVYPTYPENNGVNPPPNPNFDPGQTPGYQPPPGYVPPSDQPVYEPVSPVDQPGAGEFYDGGEMSPPPPPPNFDAPPPEEFSQPPDDGGNDF